MKLLYMFLHIAINFLLIYKLNDKFYKANNNDLALYILFISNKQQDSRESWFSSLLLEKLQPTPQTGPTIMTLEFQVARVGKEPSRLAEPHERAKTSRAEPKILNSRAGPKSHPESRGVRSLGSLVARSPGSPYSVTYISA